MEKLEFEHTYHIFNRGINGTDLFLCQKDYEYFLELYAKFIHPIADTYAWVLLKNHFHILVRIKDEKDMPFLRSFSSEADRFSIDPDRSSTLSGRVVDLSGCEAADRVKMLTKTLTGSVVNLSGCEAADKVKMSPKTLTGSTEPCQVSGYRKKANPSRQFSHLFNGYARYFNTRTERHGGLFETPFKRIQVDTEKYFRRLVYYIHHNPVKHGFAEHILDWGWSSYLSIISVKPTRISRETVLGYFDDAANFKAYHQQQHDFREMDYLLLE